MKVEENTTQRQYHYEDLHRLVKIETRTTVQDTVEKPPSPHPMHLEDDPYVTKKLQQMRKDAFEAYFGEGLDWRELLFRRVEKEGVIYISVIERATGRVIRSIKEHTLDDLIKGLRVGPGKSLNIAG